MHPTQRGRTPVLTGGRPASPAPRGPLRPAPAPRRPQTLPLGSPASCDPRSAAAGTHWSRSRTWCRRCAPRRHTPGSALSFGAAAGQCLLPAASGTLRGQRTATAPSDDRAALHVRLRRTARLCLYLTETALSQNATGQERARQGTLGYFRTNSAPSVRCSLRQGEERSGTTLPTMQREF